MAEKYRNHLLLQSLSETVTRPLCTLVSAQNKQKGKRVNHGALEDFQPRMKKVDASLTEHDINNTGVCLSLYLAAMH